MLTKLFSRLKWTRELVLIRCLTISMGVYSYWLASNRTWKPNYAQLPDDFSGTYFRNQAASILKGHLWVPSSQFASECISVDGKCYGYFGIFPSLVRMPLYLFLRSTEQTLAPVSIALAAAIGLWAILDMLQSALDSGTTPVFQSADRLAIIMVGAVLTGPGGSLVILSQAKVYREAAIWMVSLTLLAFAMSVRWLRHRTDANLIITLTAAVGATNSRPSVIVTMIGLGGFLYLHQHRVGRSFDVKFDSWSFAIVALPAASALTVMYLKFRQFTPPNKAWADYLGPGPTMIRQRNNGKMQGLRFAPTNILQYLRPDSVRYSMSQPWATVLVPDEKPAILLPPIVTNGILTEPTASVTNTMPIHLALSIVTSTCLLWRTKLSRFIDRNEVLPLMILSALAIPLALVVYSTTLRYVGDFFPFLVVGAIYGGVAMCAWLHERGQLRVSLCCLAPVALYFSLVQYSLNVGGWGAVG